MTHAYHVTGLDCKAFIPLIESLIDSGDLAPGDTAIAYAKEESTAKDIYVVCALPILKNVEESKVLDAAAYAELCQKVSAGKYAVWGNAALF